MWSYSYVFSMIKKNLFPSVCCFSLTPNHSQILFVCSNSVLIQAIPHFVSPATVSTLGMPPEFIVPQILWRTSAGGNVCRIFPFVWKQSGMLCHCITLFPISYFLQTLSNSCQLKSILKYTVNLSTSACFLLAALIALSQIRNTLH